MIVEPFNAPGIGFKELRKSQEASLSLDESALQRGLRRDFQRLLSQFESISLAEMDAVALFDRIDTKYVVSAHQLYSAVTSLPDHYLVLDIEGVRMNRYRTLYFDTNDFALYMSHHSGKGTRYKARSREYLDTGSSYLEIKWKTKRDRTVKQRVQTSSFLTQWMFDAASSMESKLPGEAETLEPKVCNEFYRITLVGKHQKERVTLDLGLKFRGEGRTVVIPGVAVAEVKQGETDRSSHFVRQMREAGVRPSGFSKYCIGVSMIYQDIKHNRFKPTLRLIRRLTVEDHGTW